MSLRKLVDQRRAAPPGFALRDGKLEKARRTTRASRRPRPTGSYAAAKFSGAEDPPAPLNLALLSVLFDRSTVPDDVFHKIVSFHGCLMPARPWLRVAYDRAASDDSEGDDSEGGGRDSDDRD